MKIRLLEILAGLMVFVAIMLPIVKREVMKHHLPEILAVLLIAVAILTLVHQQIFASDVWFNWEEFRSHESLAVCCVVAAISLIVGKYLGRR